MDVKKIIKKYEKLSNDCFYTVNTSEVLRDMKQLEVMHKPVVKQYIADWYEENKNYLETNLFCAISEALEHNREGKLSKFEKWLFDKDTEPFKVLVNMHQFGYIVDNSTKYTIKFKFIESYLNLDLENFEWFPSDNYDSGSIKTKFTKEELEMYGLDVFNNPLVEVEEVEE